MTDKQYTWQNDDRFEISGRDLGLFLNTIRAVLSTEEAAKVMLAERANEAIEAIMTTYIGKDIIKQVNPEDNEKDN